MRSRSPIGARSVTDGGAGIVLHDDTELWNLDVTICKFILPRLKAFAANIQGVPGDLTEEQWADILAHMLQSFEAYIEEDYVVKTAEGKEGFTLFVTYLRHLWN